MKKLFLLSLVLTFAIATQAQVITLEADEPPLDGIVDRSELNTNKALPYPPIRAADILWEKRIWRVIDTREKINLPFRYPEQYLYTILEDGIRSGELTAYDPMDDKFTTPMTPKDLFSQLYTKDTVDIIDPVSGKITPREIINSFDPEDIICYRVKEIWYFDTRTSTQKVRVLGIAPMLKVEKELSGISYEKPLFWIYFPHARDYLSGFQVFNDENDFGNASWEDLFEMRMFSSYIMKESNVHDRRLSGYLSGRDLLLEADLIEQELFNREQDVWSN